MQIPIEIKDNLRSCKRFTVLLKAQYYFANYHFYRDCTIIDIGRNGAAIMLPKGENVVKDNIIILEVLKKLEPISLRGSITWVRQVENGYVAGVRFTKLIDMNTLQHLG